MYMVKTTYLGPTNFRGSRVKASMNRTIVDTITIPWDCELNSTENHEKAARALANKLGLDWSNRKLVIGEYESNGLYFIPMLASDFKEEEV